MNSFAVGVRSGLEKTAAGLQLAKKKVGKRMREEMIRRLHQQPLPGAAGLMAAKKKSKLG